MSPGAARRWLCGAAVLGALGCRVRSLERLGQVKSSKAVRASLGVAVKTILRKLPVRTLADLVRYAVRSGPVPA